MSFPTVTKIVRRSSSTTPYTLPSYGKRVMLGVFAGSATLTSPAEGEEGEEEAISVLVPTGYISGFLDATVFATITGSADCELVIEEY